MHLKQPHKRIIATVILVSLFSFLTNATLAIQTGGKTPAANAKAATARQQDTAKKQNGGNDSGKQSFKVSVEPIKETGSGGNGTDCTSKPEHETAGQRIKLFYIRQATKIAAILDAVAKQKGSNLSCLVISPASEDELIIYGPKASRRNAERIIATLDLPRPGINMEMWGIQISSRHPEKMAEVMPLIRAEIDRTQQAVRAMFSLMQRLARRIAIPQNGFKEIIETKLCYTSALDASRPLSMTDILLRMAAAEDPLGEAQRMAESLHEWYRGYALEEETAHKESLTGLRKSNKPKKSQKNLDQGPKTQRTPFESFFFTRGLKYVDKNWVEVARDEVTVNALQVRSALLDFGMNYALLVHDPAAFRPYYLQQSAGVLNTRLQGTVDALNLDIQYQFVEPTLKRIQEIVRTFDDVEYAQVGKTTVASLSGFATEVTSASVSAFDVTPPLRLSDLLKTASELATQTAPFIPKETAPGATEATELTAGALPISQVIGLIAAFGEERSVWRELSAGISLKITPNVLRNMTSAELDIVLTTGDPRAGGREQGVRPLSRVSKHDVKTNVYINALDFFDLSAFVSQSTHDGGRGYVPIIGPVWRGLFGEIPGIGKMFSWKRDPQTVYHQSLVLTNSFITPTIMGVALLYPTDSVDDQICNEDEIKNQKRNIESYKTRLKAEIDRYVARTSNR